MKTLKTIFTILSVGLLTLSCSSDDDKPDPVTYTAENPLDLYMATSGFSQKAVDQKNAGIYEYGFSFKPTVTGKITSFFAKIPDVNTALRITLWDVATKTVIKSETMNVSVANMAFEKTLLPIVLTKDKEYFLSVNSDDWINRTKTDGSATTYPIVAGTITITGYAYVSSTASETIFPTNARYTYYAGDISFKFQQTE
ncbi:hypothetical protein SAMN05444397_110176 [Flavobacterium aquidurense]|uniref:DUF4082 domain-containing protein n=1 Tax=Flavobacterium frigidimaris TaxID=262320 RepID=A0ABX4BP88_FLAFR|nr:DUF4082 domain-containing protein [Flavobacterium frigidimaris]OXA78019.1 hypothetical protein B0A65_14760 [Flavobacterium frigidimaris]SDZ62031.1 hypothetical protein SAMN05444397_110176 [Flavobacterium aquidurense]